SVGALVATAHRVGKIGIDKKTVAIPFDQKSALAKPPDVDGTGNLIGFVEIRDEFFVFLNGDNHERKNMPEFPSEEGGRVIMQSNRQVHKRSGEQSGPKSEFYSTFPDFTILFRGSDCKKTQKGSASS